MSFLKPKGPFFNKTRCLVVTSLFAVAYLLLFIFLFFTDLWVAPILTFVCLFILLYFVAIDWYIYPRELLYWVFGRLTLLGLLVVWGRGWYVYTEVLLFNVAVASMLYLLFKYLTNRVRFFGMGYFFVGGYTIAAITTVFLSVFFLGKYSTFPFSCEDIEGWSAKIVQTSLEPVKFGVEVGDSLLEGVADFFGLGDENSADEKSPGSSGVASQENIMSSGFSLTALSQYAQKFFINEAVELKDTLSKNTCEFLIGRLNDLLSSGGFHLAVILIMYFLLIGIFKLAFWVVSFFGLSIFAVCYWCKLYSKGKEIVERKTIL